jgi:nucleotide-binding universal stress UspA family protein
MRILIATDGSTFSEAAVEEACKYVKPGDAEVKIIAVYEDMTLVGDMYGIVPEYHQMALDAVKGQAGDHLKKATAAVRKYFSPEDLKVTHETLCGPPDREIVEEALRWNADLIVIGSHGRGFWGRLLGSVSEGVVNHAPCPVLVVRPRQVAGAATA